MFGFGRDLAESFPKAFRSVLASDWLSSNRAWKTVPGVCDLHRRIRYGCACMCVYGCACGCAFTPHLGCSRCPGGFSSLLQRCLLNGSLVHDVAELIVHHAVAVATTTVLIPTTGTAIIRVENLLAGGVKQAAAEDTGGAKTKVDRQQRYDNGRQR